MLIPITTLPGDGIGPEVTEQAVHVLRAAAEGFGRVAYISEANETRGAPCLAVFETWGFPQTLRGLSLRTRERHALALFHLEHFDSGNADLGYCPHFSKPREKWGTRVWGAISEIYWAGELGHPPLDQHFSGERPACMNV